MNTLVWIIIWIICAFISGSITSSKGRSYAEGFILGLLLGFFGVIIAAILPRNEKGLQEERLQDGSGKKCPYCAEIIKREATVCRYCGKDLPIIAPSEGEARLSKEQFQKLTYRQRFAVTEYQYLLSQEDAEIVGRMLGSVVREKEILPFCQENGKKVISYEQ